MRYGYTKKIDQNSGKEYIATNLNGDEILNNPALNKGSAFSEEERRSLGLLGRLPSTVNTLEEQIQRAYENFLKEPTPLAKYGFLSSLLERNETLFFALAFRYLKEMAPILYTPTVGDAVKSFSRIFQKPRGLFISIDDIDHIEEIFDNRANKDVDIVIVTDSEQILGIGDQGVGGIGIAVGKALVYTLCAGVNPARVLPVVLDVGVQNDKLLNDPLYLGLRQKRVSQERYDAFLDRFVEVVRRKTPNAILHWEDFGKKNARALLAKYKDTLPTFNDDIEGTGAVALAALISATRIAGIDFSEHRVVIFGAGSAGIGIADEILSYMLRLGVGEEEAKERIWALGSKGLIAEDSKAELFQMRYAKPLKRLENIKGRDLKSVVQLARPTVLIGASAQPGAFGDDVLSLMASFCHRPIVFVLSNPTSLAEAKPQDIYEACDKRAIIATGSPFEPFVSGDKLIKVAQCNNALLYPGLGLGVSAAKATKITRSMLFSAAEAVAGYTALGEEEAVLPGIEEAYALSLKTALAVVRTAIAEGVSPLAYEDAEEAVKNKRWAPQYLPIVKEQI